MIPFQSRKSEPAVYNIDPAINATPLAAHILTGMMLRKIQGYQLINGILVYFFAHCLHPK